MFEWYGMVWYGMVWYAGYSVIDFIYLFIAGWMDLFMFVLCWVVKPVWRLGYSGIWL